MSMVFRNFLFEKDEKNKKGSSLLGKRAITQKGCCYSGWLFLGRKLLQILHRPEFKLALQWSKTQQIDKVIIACVSFQMNSLKNVKLSKES